MLKVGLTGGIGSGKSVVTTIFKQLGVPVYDADKEARLLTETNEEIKIKIMSAFGKEFFKNNILDRPLLASAVFSDHEKLSKLNSIVHPYVKKHFEQWLTQQEKEKYIIKEAAILFESGSYKELDKIISVEAAAELRIARATMRDNSSREKVLLVMKTQWSDEERKAQSDYVIVNDEQQLLIPQVLKVHELFSN